jgi:single-strand DNA-binding protein
VKHRHGDQEELHAVPVIMFGKQAENVAKYMKKDSPLMVEGYLRLYKWADRNGVHHEMLQVVAERTVFMWPDRKKKGTV